MMTRFFARRSVAALLAGTFALAGLGGAAAYAARTTLAAAPGLAMKTPTPGMSMGATPTPGAGGSMPGMGSTGSTGSIARAYNVAVARALPYTVLVTEMGMADMNAMVPGKTDAMMAMRKNSGLRTLFGPLLHTGSMPHGVNVTADGRYALVSNFMDDPGTAVQVDLRSMKIVRRFTVGINPTHFVFTPDRRYAFVTDFGSGDVYRLDLIAGTTRRITFPGDNCLRAHGDTLAPDGRTMYVACAGEAWIYTLDTRTLRPGRVGITDPGAYDVKVNVQRHELWVSNQTANTVSVLDEGTLKKLATISLGRNMGPSLLDLTPDGRRAYVGDLTGNAVSVIDTASRKVIRTIPVAAQPFGPTVTPDGRYVYEPSIKGSAVTVIRVADNRVMAVVPAPVGALHVAIAPRVRGG